MHVLDFQMLDPGAIDTSDAQISNWSEVVCVSVVSVLLCPSGPICHDLRLGRSARSD